MTEREAIEQLKRGECAGLEFLVRLYQVRAVRAAYLVTRDRALAEDVVQAAFLKVYQRIGQFDATREFGPWFFTSVVHDAVKAARARDRHASLDMIEDERPAGGSLVDERPGPEALWEQAETAEQVASALERLTPQQRAAVVARYYLELSEAESATALKLPRSTIKWRLYEARRHLRLLLSPLQTK